MKAPAKFALLALLFGCTGTGDHLGVARAPILGGTAASVGEYPTVVAITNAALCTGTLVGPDLVLTTTGCVSPELLGYSSQAEVTAATTVILDTVEVYGSEGRSIAASDTIPNPDFDVHALGQHDIGLVRLAESVTDRDPSPINRVHDDAPVGVSSTLVGFGVTAADDQSSAGQLHALTGKPSTSCEDTGTGTDANLLCFDQSDGTGSCSGDGGGPAFIDVNGVQKVAGASSFGDQNCASYGAFTRVDAELTFLDATAPELACQADGACNESCGEDDLPADPDCPECVFDDDCEIDEVCGDDGTCVPSAADDGDGGGCRAAGNGPAVPLFVLLLLPLVIGARRR